MRFSVALAALVATASAMASPYTFVETFEPGWAAAVGPAGSDSTWTREGVDHLQMQVVDFDPQDPRLGESNGSSSGGLYHNTSLYGQGGWGDNEEIYLDFHMSVPRGTYFFSVSIDAQINWLENDNPTGAGMEFYMGDAAKLAYGSQQANSSPLGPWAGQKWNPLTQEADNWLQNHPNLPEFPSADGVLWIGVPANINGQWVAGLAEDTDFRDGSTTFTTSGHVIFRMCIRDKRNNSNGMAFAMDNLVITLTSLLPPCHTPFADGDNDGDVDMDDFGLFQRCYTGPGPDVLFDEEACHCFDRDHDVDVDEADFLVFVNCRSGPNLPPDSECGG